MSGPRRSFGAILVTVVSVGALVGLIGILAYGWTRGFALQKGEADFWDLALKVIGGIVAVTGASVAISKYFDEQRKANEAALMEARKPFVSKRQEVYKSLLSATAIISTRAPMDEERSRAEADFWLIYWGVLPLVADDDVGAEADEFSRLLSDEPQEDVALRNTSMNLARACRRSLNFEG